MSHAFKIPAFPVDTHIPSPCSALGLSNGCSVEQTEKDLKKNISKRRMGKAPFTVHLFLGETFVKLVAHRLRMPNL
jgi:endonuclease-3